MEFCWRDVIEREDFFRRMKTLWYSGDIHLIREPRMCVGEAQVRYDGITRFEHARGLPDSGFRGLSAPENAATLLLVNAFQMLPSP